MVRSMFQTVMVAMMSDSEHTKEVNIHAYYPAFSSTGTQAAVLQTKLSVHNAVVMA